MGYFNPLPDKNLFVDTILKFAMDIITVIVLAFFVIYFFCDNKTVVGNSMAPEFTNGEVVLINKMSYELSDPKRFDIIAYKSENNTGIKRIIGLPGEKIKIVDSEIFINGEELKDVYFNDNYESGYASEEIEIGPDEYFVMGDNRNVSEDSRFSYVGNIKYSEIIGKVWFVASPFNRLGFTN